MQKFGIGQPATRYEDERLTTGHGCYVDDIVPENSSFACFVRSPHAHARILSIDLEEASAMPGVLGIYTVADLQADGVGNVPCLAAIKNHDGSEIIKPPRPALAEGRVRHVGDAVAMVVAESPEQARDAAEQVWVDYEELPCVVDTEEAPESKAAVWEEAPDNVCLNWATGDVAATKTAIDQATHKVSLKLVNNRVVPNSMEPRGVIASIEEGTGRLVLRVSCQGVHIIRRVLANMIFNVPEADIHVLCDDVGGGFGMKIFLFPEYVAALFAARKLQRPVKWISDRNEAFVSDCHGRDHVTQLHLGLNDKAEIVGLSVSTIANLGAYLSNFSPFVVTEAGYSMLVGCYKVPHVNVKIQGVFTNTNPVDAYRGAGRPEAIYAIERLLDKAAIELKISPAEIRRRNFITPEDMPYETALGSVYDSGDFARNMDDALTVSSWDKFAARRLEARARGKLRGIGLASYIERCAGGAPEQARMEVSGAGHITLYIGTMSNGQGHETAFRQIIVESLGVSFDDITVIQGDSDRIATGGGTMGSRSVPVGGAAIAATSNKLVEKAKVKAAELLESAIEDIEFSAGEFRVAGTDLSRSFKSIAAAAAPVDGGPSFDESETFAPGSATYPNGTHICELEIDKDTGSVEVVTYTVVDDFGKVINPLLLEGQVHGGIAQGLGQALLEYTAYDLESGQLQSATFMDYTLPRAENFPYLHFQRNEVACTTNPLGIKGAGEAGAIGAPPAIVNAVVNALQEFGITHVDMPVTPLKLWQLMQQ